MPPAPGTYTYSGTDASGKSQTFKLTNAVSGSAATTKVVTTLKSSDGKTTETTTSSWTSADILVTDIELGSADCHWSPASPMALGPFVAGKRWNIDSRCVMTVQGYTVRVHEQGSATVQQQTTATVGGQARPAWPVVTTVTITIDSQTSNGDVTLMDKSTSKDLLMPDVGLAATMDQHDEWSGFGKTKTTDQHMQLQSLRPV